MSRRDGVMLIGDQLQSPVCAREEVQPGVRGDGGGSLPDRPLQVATIHRPR